MATLRSNGAQEPEPAPPRPPPELPPQPEPPPAPRPAERPYQPPPERPPLEVPPEMPPSPAQPPVEIPEPEASGGVRVRMTPAARRRAAELVLSPSGIRGTGPDGTISLADVEAAASRGPVATPVQRAPRPGFDPAEMRKAIASAMARSKREIPHNYLTQTVDLRRALAWLGEANCERPQTERLLPAVLFLKATALALRKVPELNGFWQKDAFLPSAGIHVGWAISLRGGGLIAPAIHDADQKSLAKLMVAMRDLVQRARAGGLRSSELSNPTITVTSLGERGAETVIGVIYPPQVATIGFGRIVERPWAVDGALAVRPVATLSLAADHRASDGHRGGLLLAEIDRLLQEPRRELAG
jgi:pyruvate dehydrogenase E2 component (dihydrolipoamide acetyltransferase)